MTIEFDNHLNKFTVFYEGDDLVFDTKEQVKNFISGKKA